MNHTETILSFIKKHTEKHGFEPELTAVHRATGIPRMRIYASLDELKEQGVIEDLKPHRSKQYKLSTGA